MNPKKFEKFSFGPITQKIKIVTVLGDWGRKFYIKALYRIFLVSFFNSVRNDLNIGLSI